MSNWDERFETLSENRGGNKGHCLCCRLMLSVPFNIITIIIIIIIILKLIYIIYQILGGLKIF